jgi:hypothetical protein
VQRPQSDAEIELVERELRVLDSGLRIRWNPTARVRKTAFFDVVGNVICAEHEGREQVVKIDTPDRDQCPNGEAIVYTLEFDATSDEKYGAYRPVGLWLVDFLKKWDSAQAAFRGEWEKEWAGHDKVVKSFETWQDEAAAHEGLDRMWVEGSERKTQYPGRGANYK